MPAMITTVLVFLVPFALLIAIVAIGWAARLSKRSSELGTRVLESEEIAKIIEAADKAASLESRVTSVEDKANRSHDQLVEHETKLSELAASLGTTEQMANGNATGLGEVSERIASLDSRMAGCENRAEQSQSQLSEHETRVNELATKLGAAEQMLDEHAAGLAEANRSMKVSADEIQSLKEFRTATEKARNLILTAFGDMRASTSCGAGRGAGLGTAKPEETSRGSEEGQEGADDRRYTYP